MLTDVCLLKKQLRPVDLTNLNLLALWDIRHNAKAKQHFARNVCLANDVTGEIEEARKQLLAEAEAVLKFVWKAIRRRPMVYISQNYWSYTTTVRMHYQQMGRELHYLLMNYEPQPINCTS